LVDWLGTHQIRHAKRRSTRTVLGALGENSPTPKPWPQDAFSQLMVH
jgi:hypothetical protein